MNAEANLLSSRKLDVINLSIGGGGHSRRLYESIKYASDLGSVVVMASGNSGLEMPTFPAIYSVNYGISVGAVDINNNMASFSNRSGYYFLDYVTAPGVNIFSTVPNDGYAFYSGTSMATPHVSGMIAILLEKNRNDFFDDGELDAYKVKAVSYTHLTLPTSDLV